jgi:hypothetical protein
VAKIDLAVPKAGELAVAFLSVWHYWSRSMTFDYNAPAELFLAKRSKSNRENYRRCDGG